MEFTADKIKIKYILGMHKDSPEYPSGEDILYLMMKRASDRGEDINDITFTSTKLFKKLGDFKMENAEKSLKELIAISAIEIIRETKDSQTYKIKNNPYL